MLPEIWASPEPTVARIDGTTVRDQLEETGHARREDDIARLAALGIAATRYPVLWERVAPHAADRFDFTWCARRLDALRAAGIEPIVTLLHHGSGPAWTDLVDPAFPELFADYAEAVARRFPWVKRWTPINEPLTTARFSTLYGAWYPNRHLDDVAFGRAVVNEVRGFALAMERISNVIPDATFMLTEDLQSFTAANESIEAYVTHKRERRFLSCELLQGRVVDGHPLYRYLVEDCAIAPAELVTLERTARGPDVMGWNYYPNSERLLQGAGRHSHRNDAMVDIAPERLRLLPLLLEAYDRLRLPFALSEVHVIGNEDERARWLLQRFDDLMAARDLGVPVAGFGAWAAFGMVDWTSLLRSRAAQHEDGVYTFAGPNGTPRPTRVARVLASLAQGVVPEKPALQAWWEQRTEVA